MLSLFPQTAIDSAFVEDTTQQPAVHKEFGRIMALGLFGGKYSICKFNCNENIVINSTIVVLIKVMCPKVLEEFGRTMPFGSEGGKSSIYKVSVKKKLILLSAILL